MSIHIADKYYLKALDHYDYDLEEVEESLSYALSYDPDHVGANYLMGRLYAEHLNQPDLAEDYYQASLGCDPNHAACCHHFAKLLVRSGRFAEANKLIEHAIGLRHSAKAELLWLKAFVFELQHQYAQALQLLKKASYESICNSYNSFLKEEMSRVEAKLQEQRQRRYVANWAWA